MIDILTLTRPVPGSDTASVVWMGETSDYGTRLPGRSVRVLTRRRDWNVFEAFWVSTGVIFLAELGDKSQLMAMAFASRYRAWPVLAGITISTAAVHALSVLLGVSVAGALPTGWINLAAGLAFLGFAAWTWRGDELTDTDEERARIGGRSALVAAGVAFFIAELGDKTMLATITLATRYEAIGTWAGSTLGMVAADGLAIVVGAQLGKRLPARTVRIVATCLFVLFGLLLIIDGTRQ